MAWVCPPHTSMIVQGRVVIRWSAREKDRVAAASRYSSMNLKVRAPRATH